MLAECCASRDRKRRRGGFSGLNNLAAVGSCLCCRCQYALGRSRSAAGELHSRSRDVPPGIVHSTQRLPAELLPHRQVRQSRNLGGVPVILSRTTTAEATRKPALVTNSPSEASVALCGRLPTKSLLAISPCSSKLERLRGTCSDICYFRLNFPLLYHALSGLMLPQIFL